MLETTLANMDQGLMMVTAERSVGVFNDRALELLDLPAELMRVGVSFDDVFAYSRTRGESSKQGDALLAIHQQDGAQALEIPLGPTMMANTADMQ